MGLGQSLLLTAQASTVELLQPVWDKLWADCSRREAAAQRHYHSQFTTCRSWLLTDLLTKLPELGVCNQLLPQRRGQLSDAATAHLCSCLLKGLLVLLPKRGAGTACCTRCS